MKKKLLSTALVMILLMGLCAPITAEASNDDYAWVLVEKQYYDVQMRLDDDFSHSALGEREWSHNNRDYYYSHSEQSVELKEGGVRRNTNFPYQNIHTIYTWNSPPEVVRAGETISFNVNLEVINNEPGGLFTRHNWIGPEGGYQRGFKMTSPEEARGAYQLITGLPVGDLSPPPTSRWSDSEYLLQESGSVVFTCNQFLGQGREGNPGDRENIEIRVTGGGSQFAVYENYIYEWKKIDTPAPPPPQPPVTDNGYAWVLVEKQYYDVQMRLDDDFSHFALGEREWSHNNRDYYYSHSEQSVELKEGGVRRNTNFPYQDIHTVYTWDSPPEVVRAGETISFNVNLEVINNEPGGLFTRHNWIGPEGGYQRGFKMTSPEEARGAYQLITGLPVGDLSPPPTSRWSDSEYLLQESGSGVFTCNQFLGQGREGNPGDRENIEIRITGGGSQFAVYENYIYEWKQVSTPAPAPSPAPAPAPAPAPQPSEDISIFIDGGQLQSDVPPVMLEGRTLVPVRVIFEALGLEVDYNHETQTITGTRGEDRIVLNVDSPEATINGEATNLDVPAKIIDGRTVVPVRFIAESTGQDVAWDGSARRVNVTTK